MKKSSKLKKALIVLAVIVFSLAAVCITAAAKERVSDIQTQAADHTHVYGEWVIKDGDAATCTSEGLKTRYCTYPGCTAFYTSTIATVSDAHVYGEWTIIEEANCNKVGKKTATCKECGYVATEKIPMEEHTIAQMFDDDDNFNSADWVVTTEPVHGKGLVTREGYAWTNCTICGTTISKSFHYLNNWHNIDSDSYLTVVRASTCSEKGVGTRTCTICGYVVTEDIEIDANAHKFTGLPRVDVAPTCQSEGEGYNYCVLCNKAVKVVIDKDPDAHIDKNGNPAQWTTEVYPGVHVDGREGINCAECGHFTRTLYATHELSDDDFVIRGNPTCTKTGLKVATCKVCNERIEKIIPVNNSHSYAESDVIREATCTQTGLAEMRCTRCYGHFTYSEIPMLDHTYATDWTIYPEPTCTVSGTAYNTCVACEQTIYKAVAPDENAHKFRYAEWITLDEDKNRTEDCLKPITVKNYCDNCNKWITKSLPLHSLNLEELSRQEATCSKEGLITYQCKKCSEIVTETIPIDISAHKFISEPAVVVAATCQSVGKGINVCSGCKKEFPVTLPKDPDNHADKSGNAVQWTTVKAASGCDNGIKTLTCPGCGKTETKTVYSTHGMSMDAFEVYTYPTCEGGGMYRSRYLCPKCNEHVCVPIEKGHSGTLMTTVRKATCDADGLAFYKCTRGNHYYYEIIPATGHVSEYKITKYATCTEKGTKQSSCSVCGDILEDSIEIPVSHTLSSWIIDEGNRASCNGRGKRYRVCLNDNCDYREETYYNIAHVAKLRYQSGSCAAGGTLERYCAVCNMTLGTIKVKAGVHPTAIETEVKPCSTRYEIKKVSDDKEELVVIPGHCNGTVYKCETCGETVTKSGNYWTTPSSSKLNTCETCGVEYVTGDLLAHRNAIITQGKDATCTVSGMTNATYCLYCGQTASQQEIPATGHEFQYNENGNKVCIKCGVYKVNNKDNPDIGSTCSCFCHDKGTIAKVLYKFCNFFWKLLGINQKCECGTVHWTK